MAVVRLAQELAKRSSKRTQSVDERHTYLDRVASDYAAMDPAEFYAAPPPISPPTPRSDGSGCAASG